MALGQSTSVVVVARGVTDAAGLREYDVEISFDPRGVRMDEVAAGPAFVDPNLGDTLFYKLDEKQGKLLLVAYRSVLPDPTGDVEMAFISLTGLKQGTWPLDVTIHTLKSGDGHIIPAAGMVGAVSVKRTVSK